MRPSTDLPIRTYRRTSRGWEEEEMHIISESIVSLTVNGEIWLSFTCTPTLLEEMSVGFLFNEGIIQSRGEVEIVSLCEDGTNVDIWLNHSAKKPAQWRRTSGCTGGATRTDAQMPTPIQVTGRLPVGLIGEGMDQLLDAQSLYRETRGVHCSALFDAECMIYIAEDIGRHNTLDKLAGLALLNPKPIHQAVIITTGRISSEMLQKSARLGAVAVISRTSPTSLSRQMAEELGITLIGYARRDQFTVYAHPERFDGLEVQLEEESSKASA